MSTHSYPSSVDDAVATSGRAAIGVNRGQAFRSSPVKKGREPLLKRPLDILLSSLMLLVSARVSILVAIAIKLEDGGPVFYHQERWGRFGKVVIVLKFRTMVPDADKKFGLMIIVLPM